MIKLLEKAYNGYMYFLNKLNRGNINTDYCLLYDSILLLKNDIDEKKYRQYFENNLMFPKVYSLNITSDMERVIGWYLSPNAANTTFIWTEKKVPSLTTYYIDVTAKSGFNYLYFSIPQDVNFIIYNTLDQILYNSSLADSASQLFILSGTTVTNKGATNNVFRKKDVYATSVPVTYKIKIL